VDNIKMNVGEIVVMYLVTFVDPQAAVPTRVMKFSCTGPIVSVAVFLCVRMRVVPVRGCGYQCIDLSAQ
jgi:hypothetical protein